MTSAYRAVMEDHVPVRRAAVSFGVPQTTLRQRVLGRVDPETTSSGPSPELSQEEEAIFVEHLKSMAVLGYGYTASEVVNMASNYAIHLGKRDEAHVFSYKWFRCFMKRWPELNVTKPRSLANYRAKATSESTVNDYFQRLDHVLTKFHLKDKPQCIFNVDEKGIQTEHSPPYLVSADSSTPAVTASRSATTTILGCGNALGNMMPPFYIFKGKRFSSDLLKGSSAGSQGIVTDSGWSNAAAFQVFLNTHFLKYIQRDSADQTVLLIFDGHKSHINVPVLEWAETHKVELFVLPAHTSHLLQPLDVACFGPLQRIYNSECHRFIRSNPYSNITRYNVAELSSKAYEHALSVQNLKSGFKRTGIYPFDPSAIHPEKMMPATAYEKQTPTVNDNTAEVATSAMCFFKEQREIISKKQNLDKKQSNTLSKVTSGACITETDIKLKIMDHQQNIRSSSKRKSKESSSKSHEKKTKYTEPISPKPGPSGLQVISVSGSSSDSDNDSDIPNEEKCCVCHKYQPEQLKHCVSLIITKWAQCDIPLCKHWTHLIYCCKQRVIRRHDRFVCPCHAEE